MLSFASYKLHLQRMYHYYTESRDRQAKLQAVSDQSVAFPVTYFLPLMVPSALLVSFENFMASISNWNSKAFCSYEAEICSLSSNASSLSCVSVP